ncbi:MAG: ParB/RepB/Spo0J family partition protein [Porticoccaceae bacterium]
MATKRKGLGRGLDALLGTAGLQEAAENPATNDTESGAENRAVSAISRLPSAGLAQLPVEFLSRGQYQPRREFDPETLEELAESIKKQGLMQPVVVRELGPERYEIIAGERRWRACQLAGLAEISVVIKQVDDQTALALALIENIQREDLNAMEEGQALLRLQSEFELSQQQVADAVGKSRAAVANLMRLTKLAPEVQTMLSRGDIDMGHARALLALDLLAQVDTARRVVDASLNVRQTEKLVQSLQASPKNSKQAPRIDPDIRRLEDDLSARLGAPVKVQHAGKGGKLIIRYTSVDVLEGILEKLG